MPKSLFLKNNAALAGGAGYQQAAEGWEKYFGGHHCNNPEQPSAADGQAGDFQWILQRL